MIVIMGECMFKNLAIMIMLIMGILFSMLPTNHATDIWVQHWNTENRDIYVMDDTFSYGLSDTGKRFSISAKIVKNGKLEEVVTWHFSKYYNDMWRYYTNTMQRGHNTVVSAPNGVFEYGIQRAKWYYERRNGYYY